MFNTNSKWKNNIKYRRFADSTATPGQKDIRLGLIAPAIPGVSTFCDFNKRTPTDVPATNNNISRVVLAINRKDFAVSRVLFNGALSTKFGATSLGADHNNEFTNARNLFTSNLGYSAADAANLFSRVSFDNQSGFATEHSLHYYLLQQEATTLFVKKLFE